MVSETERPVEVSVSNDRFEREATLWFPKSVVTIVGDAASVPVSWWARKTSELRESFTRTGGIVIRAKLA